jgi:hypothetical protein
MELAFFVFIQRVLRFHPVEIAFASPPIKSLGDHQGF